jgi:lipopolysaccharide transport system permease protein
MDPGNFLLAIPAILATVGIALGSGLIFSIFTAKYRDFMGLIQVLLRLLMFVCPIFYPMSIVPNKVKWLVNLNPLSIQFEMFRFATVGKGLIPADQIIYSFVFVIILLTIGVLLFNKLGDKLIDVI